MNRNWPYGNCIITLWRITQKYPYELWNQPLWLTAKVSTKKWLWRSSTNRNLRCKSSHSWKNLNTDVRDGLGHNPSKILPQKEKQQAATSSERGINTTCFCCMNTTGEFVPPKLIFKCKRMTDDLKSEGTLNTLYNCSENGWILCTIFIKWLEHFIKCLKLQKSQESKVILILHGHTHVLFADTYHTLVPTTR